MADASGGGRRSWALVAWIARLRDRWRRRRALRNGVGRRGERVAAQWLRRHGYRLLAANARIGRDEADLIALAPDRRTLVVVEVKSTGSTRRDPVARVDRRKQQRMQRLAAAALRWPGHGATVVRFDVIGVVLEGRRVRRLEHRPGCFDAKI
ncbi:MAG: YraN family protein [Phycisphaerales bacterium]|nr:YraN family protein [Phycisphaerales bacterium]